MFGKEIIRFMVTQASCSLIAPLNVMGVVVILILVERYHSMYTLEN
jgi:hypothetical protein